MVVAEDTIHVGLQRVGLVRVHVYHHREHGDAAFRAPTGWEFHTRDDVVRDGAGGPASSELNIWLEVQGDGYLPIARSQAGCVWQMHYMREVDGVGIYRCMNVKD